MVVKGCMTEKKIEYIMTKQTKPVTYENMCGRYNYNLETMNLANVTVESAKEKIKNKINKHGLIAFDIETIIDNSDDNSFLGNTRPIVLCAYGFAFYDTYIVKYG